MLRFLKRLLLEEKLSPQVTDEVIALHVLITSSASPCSAPSPQGEGFVDIIDI